MSFPSFPPEIPTLEEDLCQCLEEHSKRKKLMISCAPGALMMEAVTNSPSGHEASPGSHHQRGFKSPSPRGSLEKMGPRHVPITKNHRQQRQSCKGTIKLYSADRSNFKDLVHEHTSMQASLSITDSAAQPMSPHTPQSTSNSSMFGGPSQPASPPTPHSIQSFTASPFTTPRSGYLEIGTNVSSLQLPSREHLEISSLFERRLSIPSSAHALSQNIDPFFQSKLVPGCASMSCLSIISEAGHVPFDDGGLYRMNPKPYVRQSSSERFLNMSPRSYEKQLSLERLEAFLSTVIEDVAANPSNSWHST